MNPVDEFRRLAALILPGRALDEEQMKKWRDWCAEPTTKETHMNHMMTDCETLGLLPGCAILSIGAVVFDPESAVIWDDAPKLHLKIDLVSSVLMGFTIDPATVKWWGEQSPEARLALMSAATKFTVTGALNALHDFYTDHKCERVWANGPTADVVWLEAAYRIKGSGGMIPPWSYRDIRDFRTIWELSGLETRTEPTLAHDALADAIAQAVDVCRAWQVLAARGTKKPGTMKPSTMASGAMLLSEGDRPEGEGWERWAYLQDRVQPGHSAMRVDVVTLAGRGWTDVVGNIGWRADMGSDNIAWWRPHR